jgi:putative transcriptional regulator
MNIKGSESFSGQFLVAMPALADPNFFQTVTCISEHNDQGALGIIVNRLHALLSADDIFSELKLDVAVDAEKIPVHIGGPVHMDEIFILHSRPFGWQGCLPITDSLAISNTVDILAAIAQGEGPSDFLIALGCAGWGPGQLEDELRENAWLTGSVNSDIIFKTDISERWESALRHMGVDPALLSDIAGHA